MSIVLELQQQAIESKVDVLSLLRKALLISRKLRLTDFEEWINAELNGYQSSTKIPDYRKVYGELKARNPYNGIWMSVIIKSNEDLNGLLSKMVTNSVGDLCAITESEGDISIPFTSSENILLSKKLPYQTTFELSISKSIVNHIIEQVKNTILNWTLALEENGIVGEGLSFTKEEQNKAQSEAQIVNYINNFYRDVNDSQIQQGTQSSIQNKK